jgi:hypothetical protein
VWHSVCNRGETYAVNSHALMRDWLNRRKARRLSEVASSIAEDDPGRALRLKRKALRCLVPPERRRGARTFDLMGTEARELLSELQRPVRSAARRWVGGRRRRFAVAALAFGLGAAALVAVVPGLRRILFPPNLAAGKSWRSTSSVSNEWPDKGVISDEAAPKLFFHTLEEDAPALVIDLGTVQRLHKLEVTNRIDCCRDRALPLEVAVSVDGVAWKYVASRRLEFREWAPSFSPIAGRFVRLRVPRRSLLHLARVAVY